MNNLSDKFSDYAVKLSHNPLGIVGLFLVLVEAIAALVIIQSKLQAYQNTILLLFIIGFPCLVLIVFYLFVTKHHEKLYSPSDYRDEKNFVKTIRYNRMALKNVDVVTEQKQIQVIPIPKLNNSIRNLDDNLDSTEIQTISKAIYSIAQMQELILTKMDQNLDAIDIDKDAEIHKLKEGIEEVIEVDLPFSVKKRMLSAYKVEIIDIQGSYELCEELRSNGYLANIYNEQDYEHEYHSPEKNSAIWIGKLVPSDIAVECIQLALGYFPFLKYIQISSDGSSSPPDEIHNQIFIGGSTFSAVEEGLKEWKNQDFNKFEIGMKQNEFHGLIRSHYK